MTQQPHLTKFAVRRLQRRKRQEALLKWTGRLAFILVLTVLASLLFTLINTGRTAFVQNTLAVDVTLDQEQLRNVSADPEAADYRQSDFQLLILSSLDRSMSINGYTVPSLSVFSLLSRSGSEDAIRRFLQNRPGMVGQERRFYLPLSEDVDQYLKGHPSLALSPAQIELINKLVEAEKIKSRFNVRFLTGVDSQNAELAGIAGALTGSFLSLFVALGIALPIGLGAAIFLEEFAPTNRFIRFIEINISNLAAVPSLVFGLLGLAFMINLIGLPRSVSLVAGLVFALRTFPTIIITTRSALSAVPSSIKDGALSLGATPVQAVFHHKLPHAAPGIFTGTIIAMAQAFGETAPLLMIGMVAFVSDIPQTAMDPATTLPVQIFIWSESTSPAWQEKTAAAILILLSVLVIINLFAAYLRRRFERIYKA